MRCKTANELFLRNLDGLLTESEKVNLQAHLEICQKCAANASEMEECLKLLDDLPEMELSDNFEWNVKRRIALEKSKVMREQAGSILGNGAWAGRFVAAAAAAMIIVLAGAWFIFNGGEPSTEELNLAGAQPRTVDSQAARTRINYTNTGYPAGIRMVSDDFYGNSGEPGRGRQLPFSMESERRIDYLTKENMVLREYLQHYKKENVYLRRLLLQKTSKR